MEQTQTPLPQKRTRFRKIRQFVNKHRIVALVIAGALLLLTAGATAYFLYAQSDPGEVSTTTPAPAPKPKPKFYSPLSGLEVGDEAATKQTVTAIMIENSPDARPQSGLKQAGVVYEAIAEGGITRFQTLHQENKPQLIGPVRSLRMYYLDWAAPYNASIAHIGGSKFALDEVRNGNYRDIDQFFNAGAYWRASDRYAPHNVYTSFERLDALNQAKGFTTSEFTGFPRVDGKPAEAADAQSIAINISSPLYNSTYSYDPATNTYARSQGGAPHLDREDGQITPSVVVALKVNMTLVMEDGYREQIATSGSGEAVIFQNGTAQVVTWHKADRASQLSFTDAAGKPVSLVRGQTWVSAVPNGSGSVSWQ